MQIHIALYKWKPNVSSRQIENALKEVEALKAKVPVIAEISTGQNASKYSEGYTHVILVRGQDQTALNNYRSHPDHAKVAKVIEAMEEHGIGVDFSTH